MYKYSKNSLKILETCDIDLIRIFMDVIEIYDVSILSGHREKKEQDALFNRGLSKLTHPHSKHNKKPSLAVDVAPYPIDFNDRERYYFLAGLVKSLAKIKRVKIRWGGDWNMNNNFKDNSFDDLGHFEIVEGG